MWQNVFSAAAEGARLKPKAGAKPAAKPARAGQRRRFGLQAGSGQPMKGPAFRPAIRPSRSPLTAGQRQQRPSGLTVIGVAASRHSFLVLGAIRLTELKVRLQPLPPKPTRGLILASVVVMAPTLAG